MIRRRFLGMMAAAGTTGAAAFSKASLQGRPQQTVVYRVTGFTCLACATGLETLLGREKGVVAVQATYPEGLARVAFHEGVVTEAGIRATIEGMGFRAQQVSRTQA